MDLSLTDFRDLNSLTQEDLLINVKGFDLQTKTMVVDHLQQNLTFDQVLT